MKNNSYKIILAHPGQQHSYHSAIALKEDLLKYITTFYYKRYNLTWMLSKISKTQQRKRIENRKCPQIDDKVLIKEGFSAAISRLGIQKVFPKLRKFIRYYEKFGNSVAKIAFKENADAVIMYDTTAQECFEWLKNHGCDTVKILDVTIGSRIYAKDLYEKEMLYTGDDCFKLEYPDLWNTNIMQKFQKEIDLADYAIVGSEFVKRTLVYSGMDENKIFVVHYGTTARDIKHKKAYNSGRLNLLFVGQVNYRKGVHRLLDAIQQFEEKDIHLNIVGNYDKDSKIYKQFCNDPKVSFVGLVPHSEIDNIYSNSDVFILPSLSEGMARVGIEALGCGLPVICTENTGVNDIIENGKNGFVIPACDTEAIVQKIRWFIENKDQIENMSANAFETGRKYTWENYYKNYQETVRKIIGLRRKNL